MGRQREREDTIWLGAPAYSGPMHLGPLWTQEWTQRLRLGKVSLTTEGERVTTHSELCRLPILIRYLALCLKIVELENSDSGRGYAAQVPLDLTRRRP